MILLNLFFNNRSNKNFLYASLVTFFGPTYTCYETMMQKNILINQYRKKYFSEMSDEQI